MATKNSKNLSRMGFLVCALLTSLLISLSAQAAVDRKSSIEASGEGSIYDLKATAAGTGSTTTFTGCISRSVTRGAQYVVLVTWDRPLPGTLPATVTTRFTGPTDANNPPFVQLMAGLWQASSHDPYRSSKADRVARRMGQPSSAGRSLQIANSHRPAIPIPSSS